MEKTTFYYINFEREELTRFYGISNDHRQKICLNNDHSFIEVILTKNLLAKKGARTFDQLVVLSNNTKLFSVRTEELSRLEDGILINQTRES